MKWLKVEREGYFPAFQCSNCGAIICVQDECFELPRYCEQCEGKKEYIERNVLLKIAEREVGEVFGSSLILRAIREAPAVDVAEVVRCCNCKHIGNELVDGKYSCHLYQLPYCTKNDFCSHGECTPQKGGAE